MAHSELRGFRRDDRVGELGYVCERFSWQQHGEGYPKRRGLKCIMAIAGGGRMDRRLAAILAADMVGYSRQLSADEAGTLARLQSIRTMVIEPELRAHGGRLFKVMGDGLLVEFASAVRALECAQAIQFQLEARIDG